MEAANFCYWLQGMFELCDPKCLDAKQTDLIRRHLQLVFIHDIDPKAGSPEYQSVLQTIHDGVEQKIDHQSQSPTPLHAKPSPLSFSAVGKDDVLHRC